MTTDFTNLIKKISPDPGGEGELRLRVGTVGAVNDDGTADITLSGVPVYSVPVLSGADIQNGQVVQILSARGTLLILGATAIADTRPAAAENMTNVSTSSTSFAAAGANNVGAVFQVPASGEVDVWFGAEMYSNPGSPGGQIMSLRIGTGDTIGAGSVAVGPSDDYAVRSYDVNRQAFANFYTWTGGTPGSVYNVQLQYRSANAAVVANFERRRVRVTPAR